MFGDALKKKKKSELVNIWVASFLSSVVSLIVINFLTRGS